MAATVEQPSMGKSSFWRFPAGQDLGHALFLIGFGLLVYGLFTVGYPNFLIPIFCAVGGAILVERGVTKWFTPPKFGDDEPEDMPMFDPMMGFGGYPGFDSEDVSRLCQAAFNFSDTLSPDTDAFTRNEDNELEGFSFKSSTVGFFGKKGNRDGLSDLLSSVAGMGWRITFDQTTDRILGSKKSDIPKLALPPNWKVVSSAKEGRKMFKNWKMILGPGEGGEFVSFKPNVFPHVAVIATSGGGKSIFLKACIEQMRAAGGQIIIGDGKGSDYSLLRGIPGVVCIGRGSGTKGVEYIGAIELAYRVMQQRMNTAAERKAADPEGWEDIPPVFLILDELKSVLKAWSTELDKGSFKAIESKVNRILALGRQMRVFVYTASQDAYAESIPPSWLTNIGMKISLGKPHHLTISKAFDESIRDEAVRIAASIDPNTRGRGMIAGVDDDSGTATVKPYQGFYSPSPGEAMPDFFNDKERAQWESFRKNVSDAVPNLHTRRWFRIDEKPEAQIKKEKDTGEEFGYIDFELFSVDEISALPIINLDMRDANGDLVPNPDMIRFDPDPTNPYYVCKPVVSNSNAIEDI